MVDLSYLELLLFLRSEVFELLTLDLFGDTVMPCDMDSEMQYVISCLDLQCAGVYTRDSKADSVYSVLHLSARLSV
jgi:hypothetical protein